MRSGSPRILVIRRDNIGDLICTTPLLRALRQRYPQAYLAVLVSSYNRDVLEGNQDIDEIFVFLKRQQKSHGHGTLATLWHRWKLMRTLRQQKFDEVILANGGWRYAKDIRGTRMVGFHERDNPDHQQPDLVVPLPDGPQLHEVEKLGRLADALGIPNALGPLTIHPAADVRQARLAELVSRGFDPTQSAVAIHISSRRPQQRWPITSFAEFMHKLYREKPTQFLVFWSPGAGNDPLHPGDDENARHLLELCRDITAFACPTRQVRELVAGMSLCHRVVCSDGGAMHVAAALGKPILCFFGDSIVAEWRPWGVPYALLQPASKAVPDIPVEEALAGFRSLPD